MSENAKATPETDALNDELLRLDMPIDFQCDKLVEHARRLERENARLREALQAALQHAPELNELVRGIHVVSDDSPVAKIRAALTERSKPEGE